MATFIAIPEKTQTATAMKKVLDYVMQKKKTFFENPETGKSYKLISGQNCMPRTAYKEFMNTKEQYRKAKGVFFKQYVQSFKPDCGATPQQIHEMGVELAKSFEGFEVVIATHIDADHWHNHFVANSVNCETGLKIQINEKGLDSLRKRSDEISIQFGFETLKPYEKPKQRAMTQREYRTALRGDSWKVKLQSAIEKAMKAVKSKKDFIANMKKLGYEVKWLEHYKYITYTTADGKKCRDNRLFDEKYLKSNMEVYFNGLEQINGNKRGNERDINRAVSATVDWSKARPMERSDTPHNTGRDGALQEHRPNIPVADTGANRPLDDGRGEKILQMDSRGSYRLHEQSGEYSEFTDSEYTECNAGNNEEFDFSDDERAKNKGFIPDQAKAEMGSNWGSVALSAIALGAAIESMVENPKQEQKKKKAYTRSDKKASKKQKKSHDKDWEMEM